MKFNFIYFILNINKIHKLKLVDFKTLEYKQIFIYEIYFKYILY
jgi:hypothetical protein